MKNWKILFTLLLTSSFLLAQTTTEALLNMLPSIPMNGCSTDKQVMKLFGEKIGEANDKMQEEKERRKKEMNSEMSSQGVQADVLGRKLTSAEMKKMEDMTDEEAEAMGRKMMEEAMKKGAGVKMMTQTEFEKKKKQADLNKELSDPVTEGIGKKLFELQKDYKAIRADYEKLYKDKINPLDSLTNKFSNALDKKDAEEAERYRKKAIIETEAICKKITAKYFSVLDRHLAFLKKELFPKLREAEKNSVGDIGVTQSKDLMALDAVIDYSRELASAYDFIARSDEEEKENKN